jgi:adenine-specific DNA-methyltransferase
MPPKKKNNNSTPIDTVKHKDKRVNIPTEELRELSERSEQSGQGKERFFGRCALRITK